MAFTFQLNPINDIARVRQAIGDFPDNPNLLATYEPMMPDEYIQSAISEGGSWQAGTLRVIDWIIAKLSRQPGMMKAGPLSINLKDQIQSWRNLKATLAGQYGLPQITASVVYTYRASSALDHAPLYDLPYGDDDL